MVMLAVTASQHIGLGLVVLLLLPLAAPRWLRSHGIGWAILGLSLAFGQVLLGIIKSSRLSTAQAGWSAAGAFVLFITGACWMLRKRPSGRQTI